MTGGSSISVYYIACLNQGPDIMKPEARLFDDALRIFNFVDKYTTHTWLKKTMIIDETSMTDLATLSIRCKA